MRKIFLVLVSVLLMAGCAYAVDLDSGITAEFAAQNTGRSTTSANSVVLQIWYTGASSDNASVGVSADTINLYTLGTAGSTVVTSAAATDTPGEIVDTINALGTGWSASVGPDSYRAYSVAGAVIASNNVYVGQTVTTAASIFDDSSTSTKMLAGVAADPISRIRLKSINAQFASNGGSITLSVYDGDTRVWQKYITTAAYNSATGWSSSANTVILDGDKGIATTKGNSLCVVVDTDTTIDTSASALLIDNVSIIYDKLRP